MCELCSGVVDMNRFFTPMRIFERKSIRVLVKGKLEKLAVEGPDTKQEYEDKIRAPIGIFEHVLNSGRSHRGGKSPVTCLSRIFVGGAIRQKSVYTEVALFTPNL